MRKTIYRPCHPANIRLDLHGVLDIIPNHQQLIDDRETIACISFVGEGSKAGVNKHIPADGPCIFIDDSTDHLRSTKYLLPHITCKLFNTGIPTQLLEILKIWQIQKI
jgi:hypothetical protein